MKRHLAVLSAAALGCLAALVPLSSAAAHADPTDLHFSSVSASWKDSTLTVRYSWDSYAQDSTIDVLVDGTSIDHTVADAYGMGDVTATSPRVKAAGPASVSIVANVCSYTADYSATTCADTTAWTGTATQVLTPPKGKSSALTLLGKLKVKAESHASSYKRSKFELWIDANGDHENTRAEVLKSEYKTKAKLNSRHTVTTGTWISPYDGTKITAASKLDIDHLVPLQEAWTSGASGWSAQKREAYANDLGYGASLIAVSAHANRSKGDKEPNAYLPALTSYRCSYVRNWIAVKYRWNLAVNSGEKTALSTDLTTYCTSNDWVSTPGTPNIKALVPNPEPAKHSGGGSGSSTGGSSSVYYKNCDAVRAAGKAPLYAGQPGYATPRLDRDGDGVACE